MAFTLVLLALVECGCRSRPAAGIDTASPPNAPNTLAELKLRLSDCLRRHHVPGIGVALVSRSGPIWIGGLGVTDRQSRRPAGPDTMFRVASITKSLTAIAILQLRQRDKIRLRDDVTRIAPEAGVENPFQRIAPVRVEDVLEHTAGFDDSPLSGYYDHDAPPDISLLRVLERFPEPQRVRWSPGTLFYYSNAGYVVAGYLVEKASGLSYADYIERNILMPLGMSASGFNLTSARAANLATGYEGAPAYAVPYVPVYLTSAMGLMSSPRDMARFVMMLLNDGSLGGAPVLRPSSLARMETPQTSLAVRSGMKYGYALGLGSDLADGLAAYGNAGSIAGFLSAYRYIPSLGAGYFFALNSSTPEAIAARPEIADLITAYVTRGAPSGPISALATVAPKSARRWLGFYRLADLGQHDLAFQNSLYGGADVFMRDGHLYRRAIGGVPVELIPVGADQYRSSGDQRPTTIFCYAMDGGAMMLGRDGSFRRASGLWPHSRYFLFRAAEFVTLSAIPAAMLWAMISALDGGRGRRTILDAGFFAAAAAISLCVCDRIYVHTTEFELAIRNLRTETFFIGTLAAPVFSALAAISAAWLWRSTRGGRVARMFLTVVSAACVALTIYFAWWGMVGYRFWVS